MEQNYETKIKTQSNMCSLIGMRLKHELADVFGGREAEKVAREEEKNYTINQWINEWTNELY